MSSRTTKRRGRRRGVWAVVPVLGATLALPSGIAGANDHVETFVAFDPAAGEFPEGVAVDQTGNLYVSLMPRNQIRKIQPSGTQSVLAEFDVPGLGPAGLALDDAGTIYVAVSAMNFQTGETDPATRGVYGVQPDGTTQHLPGSEKMLFPNDVTLDRRGNLYVTDSIGGAVWRIPRGGSAEPWLQHHLLQGDGSFGLPFPIGANGIAFHHNRIVAATTERGLLLEIPIQPDGRPGVPTLLVKSPELVGVDGIVLDVHGVIYAATGVNNTVVRVADDEIETLATRADGLNQPSTLAFDKGRSERHTLFVANFSLVSSEPTPGVLRLRVP